MTDCSTVRTDVGCGLGGEYLAWCLDINREFPGMDQLDWKLTTRRTFLTTDGSAACVFLRCVQCAEDLIAWVANYLEINNNPESDCKYEVWLGGYKRAFDDWGNPYYMVRMVAHPSKKEGK